MAPSRSALPCLALFLVCCALTLTVTVNGAIDTEMMRTRPETAAAAPEKVQVAVVAQGPVENGPGPEVKNEVEDKVGAKDYWYDCGDRQCHHVDDDISTAVIIIIVVSILLFFIGIAVVLCYCCACCCFIGRKTRTRGEVYQAQVIVPQQQPGYFYPPGQPGVSIVHNQQYQPPPPGAGVDGAPGGAYPFQGQAVPTPGFYYNNGMQVQKSNAPG